jgi:hypothetical protein
VAEAIRPFLNVAEGELATRCLPFRRADEVALPHPGYLRAMLDTAQLVHEEAGGRQGKAHLADLSLSLSAVLLVDSNDADDSALARALIDEAADLIKAASSAYEALSKEQGNPPGYDYRYAMLGSAAAFFNYAVAYRSVFEDDERTIEQFRTRGTAQLNMASAMTTGLFAWPESHMALTYAFRELL